MKKSKKGAASGKSARKQGRAVEVTGFVLLVFALFALISLASYDSNDPSFANASPSGHRVINFAGHVGAYFAQALFWFLGFVAFLLPFGLGYAAVRAVLHGTAGNLARRLGTVFFLFLIVCPLTTLLFLRVPFRGTVIQAGGIIGDLLLTFLERYLNTVGSFILLMAAFGLFLLYSTRWSLAKTLQFLKGTLDTTVKEVRIRVTRYQKSKERDKMREKVLKKYAEPPPAPAIEPAPDEKAERKAEKERKRQERTARKAARQAPPPALKPSRRRRPRPPLPRPREEGRLSLPAVQPSSSPASRPKRSTRPSSTRRSAGSRRSSASSTSRARSRNTTPGRSSRPTSSIPARDQDQPRSPTCPRTCPWPWGRNPSGSSASPAIPPSASRSPTTSARSSAPRHPRLRGIPEVALQADLRPGQDRPRRGLRHRPGRDAPSAHRRRHRNGKSVSLNALIASILYKATPEEVKLVLIDPKRLEFTLYEGIPHLLSPVINDPKKAGVVLMDAVKQMEERYHLLSQHKVRNIHQYNQQIAQLLTDKKGKLTDEERATSSPCPTSSSSSTSWPS